MNRNTALHILELNNEATDEEIKKKYKKLALKFHPDKNNGLDQKFKEISKAYEFLLNHNQDSFVNPFDMFNFNFTQNNHTFKKCNNVVKELKFTLRENHTDIVKHLKISVKKTCFNCKNTCHKCKGTGKITNYRQFGHMTQLIQTNCDCINGYIQTKECSVCNLKDFIHQEIIELKIPKCTKTNTHFIFPNLGEQPDNQNDTPGDLIFNIIIEDHDSHFTRRNDDLIYKLHITLKESLIGKIVDIPCYSQPLNININTLGIINPYKEYSFQKLGLGNVGNLILIFIIDYPDIIFTDIHRNLLNQIFT